MEKAYHEERDAYLKEQETQPAASGGGGSVPAELLDGLLAQLPSEVVQQIAQQTGLPADTTQWPPEIKQQIADLMMKQMGGT